jgi:hypothetical protein
VIVPADRLSSALRSKALNNRAENPLPSSKWLVRILGPVVQPPADFAFAVGTELLQCGTVGCQSIRDDRFNKAMPSKRFS